MRYSYTALALALATATQVTAQPSRHAARHGHSQFHAKKDAVLPEAEEKRDVDWAAALADVDWSTALADVDWSTVSYTYSEGQTYGHATPVSVAPVATSVATTTTEPAFQVTPTTTFESTTFETTTFETSTSASTSYAAAPTSSSSLESSITSIVSDVSDVLSTIEETALLAFGVISAGLNAVSSTADVWIGTDGPYTMEINNAHSEGLYLVAWGPSGSWINVDTPLVTLYLPAGSSKTLSFANGASGALSAFYSDTELVNGQLSNTWIEFTMSNDGVFDISKEVNMGGHTVEVVGPQCTSNMTTCVFQCVDSSVTSCETDYELVNCANGSQEGAQYGTYAGAASGGCGGLGESAAMTATFS